MKVTYLASVLAWLFSQNMTQDLLATPDATTSSTSTPAASTTTAAPATFSKEEAKRILMRAEEIRCLEKAEVDVALTNIEGKQKVEYDLMILNSTQRRAYVEFRGPQEERGRKMLAHGRNYWSTFPDSKRIVTVSKREMIGNSAFMMADIFQLDAENDYDVEVMARETQDNVPVLKLNLKGKHDDVPYASIRYWVEDKTYFPIKAEFYGLSGKLIKTLKVESRAELGGMLRPQVSKMEDVVKKGHMSIWNTKQMMQKNVPDSVFSKDYLRNKG